MKEVKRLFSKFNIGLKSFFKRFNNIFKPVYKSLKSILKKIGDKYKKVNSKNKYVEPIVVITASCLFVLAMILSIKSFTTIEEVNITKNSAEQLYYQNKYDEAIEEYKKMQIEDSWPEWTVKIADIYSLMGEIDKSNTLLKEVIVKRDKIVKEEGYNKVVEKDIELINSMLFTFNLNGQYEDAISFGADYISEYGENKDILKTMFMSCIAEGNTNKAEAILEEYSVDEKSAYDLSVLANMNIVLGKWDSGIELLKKAWGLDENELEIYYVIESAYEFDKSSLIKELETKSKDLNEDSYKVFLALAYSMEKTEANKSLDLIDKLELEGINNIGTDYVKYIANKNLNNKEEAVKNLDDAIDKQKSINKESYTTYYLSSLRAINNGNYDEALVYAKKSINANDNYSESYGILIPEILKNKNNFNPVEVYYREALKREPFNYKIIVNLADYYSTYASNNDKAIDYYNLGLSFNNNEILYSKIVDIYIKDNKIDEAIEILEKAIDINEDDKVYYRTLGALYLDKGMYEEGIELTRKAYSMDEKDSIALNNAAWYYMVVENDISRGYDNIKAAYTEMSAALDEEIKGKLIENYNNAKVIYEEFLNDNEKEFDKKGIKLIY